MTTERPNESKTSATDDVDILVHLSRVHVELHRYRLGEAIATTRLRQRRARVVQVEALLRADSLALAAIRSAAEPDRVTVDVLDQAVAGDQRAYESATRRAARSTGALPPLLAHLSEVIAGLEREAHVVRTKLSPSAARILDVLERKKTLPLVARLDGGACGACHLCVPTALASAVAASQTIQRCPHCKRVLVVRDRI